MNWIVRIDEELWICNASADRPLELLLNVLRYKWKSQLLEKILNEAKSHSHDGALENYDYQKKQPYLTEAFMRA